MNTMYTETGDIHQDAANDNPEELPTYNYLEEQERSNPNSRFGRWRGWVEKRAAERYAGISEEDRERQRQRGWGATVTTGDLEEAPPAMGSVMSPISAQPASERLGTSSLSIYQFGSRFIPHSSSRITCLVPLLDERYLLLGSTEGMGLLDMFPSQDGGSTEDPLMLHPLEGVKRRDLWIGEAVYQMSILESYIDANGDIQGVLLALVGPEEIEPGSEATKSVRLYNLSSIHNLIKLVTSNPDLKTLEINGPKGWTHQHTTIRKLHRNKTNSISLTRSLKSMVLDSHEGSGSRPATPADSTSSLTAASISSDRPPPHHKDTKDSANSTDSWDMVEDVPLRLATNYVNLATVGSKLAALQILFYEIYKDENRGDVWMLAVATKTCILLYETPPGGRSFRYIKEFYTPLPAKSINFIHQSSREGLRPEGERLKKERPLSRSPESSPQAKRMSSQTVPTATYKSNLSLFVVFEKKAGIIRLYDSAVNEIELWDDGDGDRPPSPNPTNSPMSIHSSHSFSSFRLGSSKATWLPLVTVDVPNAILTSSGIIAAPVGVTTLIMLSRGRQTQIFPSPLPTTMASHKPLRILRWTAAPRQITARLSIGSLHEGRPTRLQILAFSDHGVEVIETTLDFLSSPPDISWGKGKGTVRSMQLGPESYLRASWQPIEITGVLGRGGYWDTLDTSSGRPEIRRNMANAHPSSRVEQGQGLYVWLQKGMDYRVAWLGEDTSP